MMPLILTLDEITDQNRAAVGGKAYALSRMSRKDLAVPEALCIRVEAYHQFLKSTGLVNEIVMELYRKPFEEMRWEEIWDTALRIRNAFMRSPIPPRLFNRLAPLIESTFSGKAVAVRSSAPGEDSEERSFAGLHESYVNLKGTETILEHVRLVWASLWSDRALLYRQELGLDVKRSAMAVVVQEMVFGDRSGVVFSKSPLDASQSTVEAVYGLNQGLVDGTIEPDQWTLSRKTGEIISHQTPARDAAMRPAREGVRITPLPSDLKGSPPLDAREVQEVYRLVMEAESMFGSPQDTEWTYRDHHLYTLQARPITTGIETEDDQRPWYLTLHRSFENLKDLRHQIEDDLLPAMEQEALEWSKIDLRGYSDETLALEIERRISQYDHWLDLYRRDCIPFAHGMRLFGQVYNDVMHPEDPFEFIQILGRTGMKSLDRNQKLIDLASQIRDDPELKACLYENRLQDCDPRFQEDFENLLNYFGDLAWENARFIEGTRNITHFLIELGDHTDGEGLEGPEKRENLEKEFMTRFPADKKDDAWEMIDLGRASYRLRDDDNIYLGRIEGQMIAAIEEGKERLKKRIQFDVTALTGEEVIAGLNDPEFIPEKSEPGPKKLKTKDFRLKARQIVGQPAGPGIAIGTARVIKGPEDLFTFKRGEILICDSVDPGMTFVVPLAAGIIERRGGMLIHGAIIAREYGIPCVTGAPGAAEWIRTGDTVTVDGFLGIVIIGGSR